ncbi:protein Churchill-like [Amphiura filiformis]|uniref:protein Churchill-like n=1 Tax=Amphiura filiformis TaxID=82378 RepID=UPI003B214017
MCVECVKDKCPDRGRTCLETGSYLLNFQGCAECHKKEPIKIEARQSGTEEEAAEEDAEGGEEELITFDHVCSECGHIIAEHQYTFCVDGEYQEYSMTCMLCGRGSDSISVLPNDPRKVGLGVF